MLLSEDNTVEEATLEATFGSDEVVADVGAKVVGLPESLLDTGLILRDSEAKLAEDYMHHRTLMWLPRIRHCALTCALTCVVSVSGPITAITSVLKKRPVCSAASARLQV